MSNASQATNERSLRSVFVGNIPYDATEEKLKDIFSEVGPVLSFKLVYDRESGKPKGYGFCEYRDQETALSAMRNLNSYELNGRNLRVDTATNERFKEEIKNLQMSMPAPTFESPYGPEADPDKTPETIAKVVSSLPPEKMLEIAKQMKHCVLTNPNEARNMLLQNPQLAYALLQLLVVMRAVDVNMASTILYKPNPAPVAIPPAGPVMGQPPPMMASGPPMMQPMPPQAQPPQPPNMIPQPPPPMHPGPGYDHYDQHADFNRPPPAAVVPNPQIDLRHHLDPRLRQNEARANEMFDPRMVAAAAQQPAPTQMDPRLRQQSAVPNANVRSAGAPPPGAVPVSRPPSVIPPPTVPGGGAPSVPPAFSGQPPVPPVPGQFGPGAPANIMPPTGTGGGPGGQANQSEAEKAQLIMQVLSLSDQQINMLPADQRQSILMLRQQLQQQQS